MSDFRELLRPWECAWHHPGDDECFDASDRSEAELERLWRDAGPYSEEADRSAAEWNAAWAISAHLQGSEPTP